MDGNSLHFSFIHIEVIAYYTDVMLITPYRTHLAPELILALDPYDNSSYRITVKNNKLLLD